MRNEFVKGGPGNNIRHILLSSSNGVFGIKFVSIHNTKNEIND